MAALRLTSNTRVIRPNTCAGSIGDRPHTLLLARGSLASSVPGICALGMWFVPLTSVLHPTGKPILRFGIADQPSIGPAVHVPEADYLGCETDRILAIAHRTSSLCRTRVCQFTGSNGTS